MQTWLALLGAPSLVLINLSVNYALASQACTLRSNTPLLAVNAVALACAVVATLLAWHRWRQVQAGMAVDSAALTARGGFLALVATGVGLVSTVALSVMLLPSWLLPPC
jgi:membrane protein YdbS with pleckstrin-like domain